MEVDFMAKKKSMCALIVLGVFGLAPAASRAGDTPANTPGPIHSLQDLQDVAKMLFKLADTNNDGQISQKEAIDVGNLLVGGFFFRADANGDGVVTLDEAQQAREALFHQQPLLRFIVERAKPPTAPRNTSQGTPVANQPPADVARNLARNPAQTIGNLLDTNHDQKLEASELRQAVQTGVQALFMVADTNNDGQLSPYELNAAAGEIVKSAAQIAFQAADTDHNGTLSVDEYDQALAEPAHAVFRILDANSDSQLSLDELQRAEQILVDQIQRLRVREPSNSLSRQLQSGPTAAVNPQAVTTIPSSSVPAPGPRP
jgi:Ca2+-binding EF-hand superfamily protein